MSAASPAAGTLRNDATIISLVCFVGMILIFGKIILKTTTSYLRGRAELAAEVEEE